MISLSLRQQVALFTVLIGIHVVLFVLLQTEIEDAKHPNSENKNPV